MALIGAIKDWLGKPPGARREQTDSISKGDIASPSNGAKGITTKRENDSAPPSYNEAEFTRLGIKATDTPQWLWSNAQCRAWLTAVGVTLFNYDLELAEFRANEFEGTGTLIYNWPALEWLELYGCDLGSSLYNLLYSVRRKQGAVPLNITFPHWNNDNMSTEAIAGKPYEIPGRGTVYYFAEDEHKPARVVDS